MGLALLLMAALGDIAYAAQAGDNATATATKGFALKDQPGQHLDILLDGRLVGRYMYAYDKSSPAKLHETYKPYLHIFDAEGQSPITKGPGGEFTHHRGIFIGWRKIRFEGQSYDRWHMIKGEIVHEKFLTRKAGPDEATITSLTHWNDAQGQPIVNEQRTMTFRRAKAPARLIVDFQAKLTAPRGNVVLDGDPEHAGVQYRPANEVVRKETVYVFPKEHANAHKDKDYPWVGETYTLAGKRYSVVEMNHPDNPKQTVFSAYRDYGRFGAFFTQKIKSGDSLTVKYRFLIADGENAHGPVDSEGLGPVRRRGPAEPGPQADDHSRGAVRIAGQGSGGEEEGRGAEDEEGRQYLGGSWLPSPAGPHTIGCLGAHQPCRSCEGECDPGGPLWRKTAGLLPLRERRGWSTPGGCCACWWSGWTTSVWT